MHTIVGSWQKKPLSSFGLVVIRNMEGGFRSFVIEIGIDKKRCLKLLLDEIFKVMKIRYIEASKGAKSRCNIWLTAEMLLTHKERCERQFDSLE